MVDEKENEELNHFEPTDFNAGILFNRIERTLASMHTNKDLNISASCVCLPKIQVLPPFAPDEYDANTKIISAICKRVHEHFDAVYSNSLELEFNNISFEKKYVKFEYIITRKSVYKEMTIEQIEKELGYKIKVVGDKQ